MDVNEKLGKTVIKNDPNEASKYGKVLLDIIERNNLKIGNSLDKCKCTITRNQKKSGESELSVIDYVLMCEDMEEILSKMEIDEDRQIFHEKRYPK